MNMKGWIWIRLSVVTMETTESSLSRETTYSSSHDSDEYYDRLRNMIFKNLETPGTPITKKLQGTGDPHARQLLRKRLLRKNNKKTCDQVNDLQNSSVGWVTWETSELLISKLSSVAKVPNTNVYCFKMQIIISGTILCEW